MSVLRGTTPTVILVMPETVDVSGASSAYLSFGQLGKEVFSIPLARLTLSDNTCTATLTQAETLSLSSDQQTKIQLRWVKEGVAYGTKKVSVPTEGIIKEGVI